MSGEIGNTRFWNRPVLVFWILVHVSVSTSTGQKYWQCTGPETRYTSRDCEIDKEKILSDNCYYLQHFQQYRPCSKICNNVALDSIDEDRCRAYCPRYLHSYCKVKDPNLPRKPPSTQRYRLMSSSTARIILQLQTTAQPLQNLTLHVVLISLIILSFFIFIAIIVIRCMRRKNDRPHHETIQPVVKLPIPCQVTDDEMFAIAVKPNMAPVIATDYEKAEPLLDNELNNNQEQEFKKDPP